MNMTAEWVVTVPVEKSDREGNEGWFIRGLASGPGLDPQLDKITPEAITNFANQLKDKIIPFRNYHKTDDIDADMGEVVGAYITEEGDLGVEIELDKDHPKANWMWKKLDAGKQFGLSIHGNATDWSYEIDPQTGKRVRILKDVALDEISATTRPSFTKSFGSVVRKSLDDAEKEGSNLSEANVTAPEAEEVEKSSEEIVPTAEAPAPEANVAEQSVEKALTPDTSKDAKKLAALVANHKKTETILRDLGLLTEESQNEDSSEEAAPVEKSVDDTDSTETVIKSLTETILALKAQVEDMKDRIPGTTVPPAVVSKSRAEEAAELVSKMGVSERIRYELALKEQGR